MSAPGTSATSRGDPAMSAQEVKAGRAADIIGGLSAGKRRILTIQSSPLNDV
jgi:hypothetical protein